ncbi:PLP-dependent aminotransferase family protein [Heyndrickxia sporothermodurans]
MIEITPNLNKNHKDPLYIQLYEYIKKEIENGRIPPGTRLPSIRKLSSYLRISRNTIDSAYQQLMAEGYIESRPRSGLFVTVLDNDFPVSQHKEYTSFDEYREYGPKAMEYTYDFRHGSIDQDSFPTTLWRRLTNQVCNGKDIYSYGERQGEIELRIELAKYLYQSRGVSCSPKQMIIGGGIQQLLGLLCLMIGLDGQSVAVENPGYDGARAIFAHYGFQVEPIEVNKNGLCLPQLYQSDCRLAYVTPSHQFPLGYTMPISKRMKLLQWAEKVNGFIIEDDYDSEFRYKGKPIPALKGIDSFDRVVYLGTFSKSLLPSIRLSYMVLPEALLKKHKNNFYMYEQAVSKIHQLTLLLFMQQGHWQKHIHKMRKIYEKKHEVLRKAIKQHMGENVNVVGEDSGLHIIIEVKREETEESLIAAAKNVGVKVYSASKFWVNQKQNKNPQLLLGFGGLSEEEIDCGIQSLSNAWF